MESFCIKKMGKNKILDYPIIDIEGFKYTPKKGKYQEIINFTVVKPSLINGLIMISFDKKYKKILEMYLACLSDEDTSDGSLMLALNEVARLRHIIITKYQKVLSKKMLEKLLKKLKILENEMRIKIIDLKIIQENEQEVIETGIRR